MGKTASKIVAQITLANPIALVVPAALAAIGAGSYLVAASHMPQAIVGAVLGLFS